MKLLNHSWIKWVCSGILLAAPLAPVSISHASSSQTMGNDALEQIKKLPPKAQKIVEETAEYLFRSQDKLEIRVQQKGEDSWNVQVNQHSDEIGAKQQPSSLSFSLSKGGKLDRLDVSWDSAGKKDSINQWMAVDVAEGFVSQILGTELRAGTQSSKVKNEWFAIPLYPVVDEILVRKEAATLIVDASGNVRTFHRKDIELRPANLPSRSGVITNEEAKQAWADELSLELVYDDEIGQFGYEASAFSQIDAKTGEPIAAAYHVIDEDFQVDRDKQPAPMTADRAKALVSSYTGLDGEKLNVRTSRQKHPDEDAKTIFTITDGKRIIVLQTGEETGELLKIHEEEREQTSSNEKNSQEAKQKARTFIEAYAHLENGDYVLREKVFANREASDVFQFELYPVHGAVRAAKPVLTLNFERGQNTLSAMTTRPFERFQAEAPAVLTEDVAKQVWMNAISLELQYVYPDNSTMRDEQAKLVYVPSIPAESRFLNVITGQLKKAAD